MKFSAASPNPGAILDFQGYLSSQASCRTTLNPKPLSVNPQHQQSRRSDAVGRWSILFMKNRLFSDG